MKTIIKKAIILVSLLLTLSVCRAQYVAIPDSNFAKRLNTMGYTSCLIGNSTVGWQLDTTCPAVSSTTSLNLNSYLHLQLYDITGVTYFRNLTYLDCAGNWISTLPALPASLTYLNCSTNTVLSALPALPASLNHLDCSYNSLTSLPALPASLGYLDCSDNQINTLPALPGSMTHLICWDNHFTSIPTLPGSLVELTCWGNSLSSLPTLPNSLKVLTCQWNQITSLPALPLTLNTLLCDHNLLSSLPVLPPFLDTLTCDSNQITSLPTLSPFMRYLSCAGNQLTSLPALPSYMGHLDCDHNPNLVCMPQMDTVLNLSFISTGITCLPNYPLANQSSNPALGSVPICTSGNPNGCTVLPSAAGPYQGICQGGTVTMAATGTGTWSAQPYCPSQVTIANPSLTNTVISGFDSLGIYTFKWTASPGGDSSFTEVFVHSIPAAPTIAMTTGCLGSGPLVLTGVDAAAQINWYESGTPIATTSFPAYTVAGGNGQGNASNQFDYPYSVAVDGSGNIYVCDVRNARVQKFPAGSSSGTSGITVAGGNGAGSAANQLNNPEGIFIDNAGDLYVADFLNYRIQKFPAGSTSATNGVTVAGGNGAGTALNQISAPAGVFVDAAGNIYVADEGDRVEKFPAGSTSATNGVIVAGGNGNGSAANQITPFGIYVDGSGNLYVSDYDNARIQMFPAGSTSATNGVTVAGGNGFGNAANQLYEATSISVNSNGDLYVCDSYNSRVQKFPAGSTSATSGITVAGITAQGSGFNGVSMSGVDGAGNAANQLFSPTGIWLDSNGDLYVSDDGNLRVQKYTGDHIDSVYTPGTVGIYTAVIVEGGCPSAISNPVIVVGCTPDSTVWPGDADANHVVDNTDLLPIGLAYDSAGPARAVQGIVWQGDQATNWADSFSIYAPIVNFKHADCDGNGIVDANDTVAIVTNFGLIHAKTNGSTPWRSGLPGLRIKFSQDTVYAGDTLITSFILGDSSLAVNNIAGIAFTYHYDPIVVDTTMVSFSFIPSWLGGATDAISISKNFTSSGTLKAAITRIDHTNRSGYGVIGVMYSRITADNINGKDLLYYSNKGFISDIVAIDAAGNPIAINAGTDSDQVAYTPTGLHELAQNVNIKVYPNPAKEQIKVTAGNEITDIRIYDMLGKVVIAKESVNRLSEAVDVSALPNGVYTIGVITTRGRGEVKLIIGR